MNCLVLIFSRNRALQLDATLRSFLLHCQDVQATDIRILYTTTEPLHCKQYEELSQEYDQYSFIQFISEQNFRSNVLTILGPFKYVLFVVDDNLFVRDFFLQDALSQLDMHSDAVACSLRLGRNTHFSYMFESKQRLPEFRQSQPGMLKYRWPEAQHDFGYPLEVSSSVYRVSELFDMISPLSFSNPNTLESEFANLTDRYAHRYPFLLCYEQSVTFCNPINLVQTAWKNRSGQNPAYSSESLAKRFGEGYRVNVDSYTNFIPQSVHQEVELKLELPGAKPLRKVGLPSESHVTVSVVIPCYQQATFLPEAVKSVVLQTYSAWEIIIVDDGSPDDTVEVAEALCNQFPGRKIRCIRQNNLGLAEARNTGIRASVGQYILPLDADDMISPTMLEKTVHVLKTSPEIGIAYPDTSTFGDVTEVRQAQEWNFPILCTMNILSYCALYRREVWETVGGYNPNMKPTYEDWDFWIGCGEKGFKGLRIPEPLFIYRVRKNTLASEGIKHDRKLKARIILNHPNLYKETLKKSAREILGSEIENESSSGSTKADDALPEAIDTQGSTANRSTTWSGVSSATPLVSVIIPTKNRANMLIDAVRSILKQTYRHFEIIIINDGGGDVEGVLSNLDQEGRIVYVRLPQSRERSYARNLGVEIAQGTYIAYLDDDDQFYPNHLATLVEFLETTGHKVAYTDAYRVHQVNENGSYVTKNKDLPYSSDFDYDGILVNNFIPNLCLMHAKSCMEQVGGFDGTLVPHEDWDFLIRLSQVYSMHHLKTVTAEFSWRTDGSTSTSARQPDFLRTRELIYEKYLAISQTKPNVYLAQQKVLGKSKCSETTSFDCSIIIPVFNKAELTEQCLTQLAAVTESVSYEIIVVDNNSTDGTREFLDTIDGDVQIIRNEENLGFAKACNQGARAARGKYFVFLNNDTIPQFGWLQALVNEADCDPNVAIVGSKLLYPDNTVQHAGIVFNRKSGLPYHWASKVDKNSPLVSQRKQYKAVTGACMLVKREVFERVKGFDEAYINGYEDIDLCLKIERQNEKVIYQPESCLYHLESQTQGRQDHMDHNRDLFLSRWGNIWLEDQDIVAYEHGCAVIQVTLGQSKGTRLVPMTNEMERIQWRLVANVQELLHESIREILDRGERGEQLVAMLSQHDQWPLDPGVLEWGGYVCDTLGFQQYACEFWHKLLKIDEHIDARRSLIRSTIRRGRLDEAQEHLDIIKRDGSFRIEDVILQGTLFLQREQYDNAKFVFLDGLAQEPQNHKTRLGLGMAILGQGSARDAFGVFEAILKEDPDNQDAIHWIVRAGYAVEDWGGIAEHLEHFLLRNPANCDIRFTLAGVYLQGKMREKFQKEYETLRLLKPDYEGLEDLDSSLSGSFSSTPEFTENEVGSYANQNDMSCSHSQSVSMSAEKRVSVLVSDTICGAVRLVMPLMSCIETLGVDGKVFNALENDHVKNTLPAGPQDVWLSHRTNVLDLEIVKMARDKGTRIVHDIDDLIWNLPDDNPNASLARMRSPNLRTYLPSIDCVTVATDPIKEYLSRWDIESLVLPNCLFPKDWVGLDSQPRVGRRPRVGWAGQAGVHKADLALLTAIIEVIGNEVEWVFLGDSPEVFGNSRVSIQVYPMATIDDFPRALADLHLDVALAPLAHNEFNEAKSDIRILQYGILGYSVIATDIYPHREAPVERIPNDPTGWVRAIRERIHDLDATQKEGETLRQWVLANRMIDNYLSQYQAAWFGELPASSFPEPSGFSDSPGVEITGSKKEIVRESISDCSIIIPVFNKAELTKQCLAQLAKVTDGVTFEVIIVDNHSTDGTKEFLDTLDGDVQIIRNSENLGFAKACNQGARAAHGKYLVFLNNDTIPQSGWLSSLVEEAESHNNIAIVGSKLLYADGTLQHGGVVISRTIMPYHIYRSLPGESTFVNRRREFQAVTAACMLVKRTWFNAVGGFDEAYRNGFEDVDLCLHIGEKGGKIVYQPKSWLYHLESQSPGRHVHNDQNVALFLTKWGKKHLADEDCIAFEDGIALLVEDEKKPPTLTYRQLKDEKETVRWSRVAQLQHFLYQCRDPNTVHDQTDSLSQEIQQFVNGSGEWPRDAAVLEWVGLTCYAFGHNGVSEKFFRQAIQLGKSHKSLAMLARFDLHRGNLVEAGRHLMNLLEVRPNDGSVLHLYGVYLMQCEKFSEAVETFRRAIQYEGDRKKAQHGMGMAYLGMGKTRDAWEIFTQTFNENPDDVESMNWVIRAGTELADWKSLSTMLERFVERNPANGDVRFALASVQVRQGNSSEARSHLQTLHLLNPEHDGIQDLAHALDSMEGNLSSVANS